MELHHFPNSHLLMSSHVSESGEATHWNHRGALKSDSSPGSTPGDSEVIDLGYSQSTRIFYSLPQVIVMCLGITAVRELIWRPCATVAGLWIPTARERSQLG